MTKQTPSASQLRTAIKVLNLLDERIRIETAYSVIQLPKTELGSQYAGNLERRALEQSLSINLVSAQLENWREEVMTPQTSFASLLKRVKLADLVASTRNLWIGIQSLVAARPSHPSNGIGKMIPKSQH